MTQIVVTLEKDADSKFLRRMIENMKGVVKASVKREPKTEDKKTNEWLEKLHSIKDAIDPSLIDMTDERTRYIMSK